jgi:NADH:ubiquinone oxidoreductase subunit 6 (subunit J)
MKLALQIPFGPDSTPTQVGFNPAKNFPETSTNLAKVINEFGQVAIYVGAVLMFFWALWGVFDYLKAEGNKEGLAKARKKIQWAIAGFVILLLSFFISQAVEDILVPSTPPLTVVEIK